MSHLAHTDGVMIGREVFSQPWLLAEIEQSLYQDVPGLLTRIEVQKLYAQYIEKELQTGTSAHALVKPLSGLNGAKYWRRLLTETVQKRPNAINDLAEIVAGYKQ